jgi:competence protein ComEC
MAWLLGACVLLLQRELPSGRAVLLVTMACVLVAALTRRWAILGFALGLGLAWQQCSERLGTRLDPALEGASLTLSGQVASVPQDSGEGLRFRLATRPQPGLPPLVELTWYEPDWRPRAAERLELEVRLRRPRGFANPGGGDHESRLLREGVGATGYVRSARRVGRGRLDVA